jgi:hypothetical protein
MGGEGSAINCAVGLPGEAIPGAFRCLTRGPE